MSRDFIDELFYDIFGDKSFDKMFDEFEKRASKTESKSEKECNNKDEKEHSYYHKVADTYEDGKHTSHIEKEVKDGEVLKDVKEAYQLEDKKKGCDKKICCKDTCKCGEKVDDKQADIELYEKKLKEANDLLDKANRTIQMQMDTIDLYEERVKALMQHCDEYENKFNAISKLIR